MSASAGRGVGLVEGPRGVGGADDPVPAPRDHEQHRRLRAHDEAGLASGSGRAARPGGCPSTAWTCSAPRPPTISWISSVQTPAALTTTRARTSKSRPCSRSRARTPTTRSPSRRKPVTFTRVATCAPWPAAVRGDRHHQPGVVDLAVVVLDRARDRLGLEVRRDPGDLAREEVAVPRHAHLVLRPASPCRRRARARRRRRAAPSRGGSAGRGTAPAAPGAAPAG